MKDPETLAREKIKKVLSCVDLPPIKRDRLEDSLVKLFVDEAPLYLQLSKTRIKDKSLGWVEVYLLNPKGTN